MFKNAFSFDGRIRRIEYVQIYIVYMIANVVIACLFMVFGDPSGMIINILMILLWIPLIWFILAQEAKLRHKRDNSGWWKIIPFYNLRMLFADGKIGDTEYGKNSKLWPY